MRFVSILSCHRQATSSVAVLCRRVFALLTPHQRAEPGYEAAEPRCRGKEEETYFDHVKADIAARQAETRADLDAMDVSARVRLEGLRPGAYVRIRLAAVPCELVQHFDPAVPLLLGGIAQGEDKVRLIL